MSPDEYSREVTVQADGQIQMPLIGTVMVKGLTISELQRLILNKYARYMANPRVMASVRRFSGRRVAILGEVRGPGYYDYREGMGLLELVSLAGGLNPDARASRVRILRKGEKERSFAVNFKAVLEGDLSRDPLLAPGDTVIVPQQPFTSGGAWVNRNILPWAAIFSMIGTIAVITAR